MKNKTHFYLSGIIALTVFAFFSYLVRFSTDRLSSIDQSLTDAIRYFYPIGTSFFLGVTKFGNPAVVIIIFLIILTLLIYKKYSIEAIWFGAGVVGIAGILNFLIKLIFMRERPTLEHLVTEHSYSFPSGHSTGSMVLYGTLIFLLPIFIQNKTLLRSLQFFLGLFILSIGVSRIFIGVHFPSDVLGGFSLGLAWLLLTYPIYKNAKDKHIIKE